MKLIPIILCLKYSILLYSILLSCTYSIKIKNEGQNVKSEVQNLIAMSVATGTNSTNLASQVNQDELSTEMLNKGSIVVEKLNTFKAIEPKKFDFDNTFITGTVSVQNNISGGQLPPEMSELKNIENPTIIKNAKVPNSQYITVVDSPRNANIQYHTTNQQLNYQSQPNMKNNDLEVKPILNPVPIMTHYNMPVLHHIPINTVVKKYVPVYYPIPVEHRINIPVRVPIKIPQKVLIPQAVPYGVKVPVPFPVKVEVPQYKEIEVKKPVYVKIPIYEHIPIYHHFAVQDTQTQTNNQTNDQSNIISIQDNERSKKSSNRFKKKSNNQRINNKQSNEQNLENFLYQKSINHQNSSELSKLEMDYNPNQASQESDQETQNNRNQDEGGNDNQLDQLIDSLNCDKKTE